MPTDSFLPEPGPVEPREVSVRDEEVGSSDPNQLRKFRELRRLAAKGVEGVVDVELISAGSVDAVFPIYDNERREVQRALRPRQRPDFEAMRAQLGDAASSREQARPWVRPKPRHASVAEIRKFEAQRAAEAKRAKYRRPQAS